MTSFDGHQLILSQVVSCRLGAGGFKPHEFHFVRSGRVARGALGFLEDARLPNCLLV